MITTKKDSDRVVFFDVDDTLLDTSAFAETARRAALELMVDNGLPLDKDEAYGVLKTIIRERGSNYGKHFNVLTKVVLGHEDPMLIALGMITYHNVKMALLRPFAQTIDTLIYLKSQGYRLAVISNGITIKQWEKLVRLNIYQFFDAVITSEEVGKKKPDKLIYDVALRKMQGNPDKSIMIGNKFKEDALGAVNAGMSAILVNSDIIEEDRDYIKKEQLDITIIENIGDVNKIL
ncbi:TIGR02253 family HAD-type hydrolase [Methanobrevibacter oralis]|uniref:Glyceraldehyde 3-phosphate phosphatase n=1 Tax=Methanobrevibacter oralis TaxID=66851 RepID=A0A166B8C9_METOA|nr:TIGR02253 family HAD-type hydrolase [Methanobrevibacter oralis]KZX13004.1 pyrimidine 5'-nucleotidase YjjG [Methanobrevibacter oralis]